MEEPVQQLRDGLQATRKATIRFFKSKLKIGPSASKDTAGPEKMQAEPSTTEDPSIPASHPTAELPITFPTVRVRPMKN